MASPGKGSQRKGKAFELKVAKMLRKVDPDAKRMPRSGAFEHLRADIWTNLTLHIECKCHEKLQIWKWWEDTQSKSGYVDMPILAFSSNHRPVMAALKLEDLIDLLKIKEEYLESVTD